MKIPRLIKDESACTSNLCIVGSGAIACDGDKSSWRPLEEQLASIASSLDFVLPPNLDRSLYAELLCSWIGEHARVTTSRLAHHLVVSLLNQRKQSEGQSLLESINQEEGLKPCLEDLDRRYNNSWFSTDWYSSAELTKSFGCFASLFDQWQALEGAREALAKIYFSAQPRLNKRLFDQDVETALLESWVLTLNWDMTLWNLLPRVAQWHGQCSDPCTMILPTEVHDTLEIIPVLAPKDLSWMSDDQKTFYEWCIRRVKALHAASCKAHDLIRQATTIWFIGCALNTYDCELNTAFSKAGVPCLSMVNVVNRWENASKTSARMKFLVSRRAGVNFRYIGT